MPPQAQLLSLSSNSQYLPGLAVSQPCTPAGLAGTLAVPVQLQQSSVGATTCGWQDLPGWRGAGILGAVHLLSLWLGALSSFCTF